MRRRFSALVAMTLLSLCIAPAAYPAAPSHWVAAWATSPDSPGPSLAAQTVRQVVRVGVAGRSVRVRLSNLFGTQAISIGPAHVALHATGSSIVAGSDHAMTFGGASTVTIAQGDSVLSDPVPIQVSALQDIAISLYVPGATGPSTVHGNGLQTAWVTRSGDATAALALPGAATFGARLFISDVEVEAPASARAIVAFGDSITDGYGSTLDRNARWPDALAQRLQSDPSLASIAVVNAGVSGNRILHDGAGPSALARFDRDALDKPGVRWIVLFEGINDIGAVPRPSEDVSAQQIIAGLKMLIARAHARHVRVCGATLIPFGGVPAPYYSAAGDAKRAAVNAWIRTAHAFDAVVDFDKALRDPAHPDRLLPAFNSGDHLHPGDAGYAAMAAAIDLKLLRGR